MKKKIVILTILPLSLVLFFSSCNLSRRYHDKILDDIEKEIRQEVYEREMEVWEESIELDEEMRYEWENERRSELEEEIREELEEESQNKIDDGSSENLFGNEGLFEEGESYQRIEVYSHTDKRNIIVFDSEMNIATILFNIEYDSWEFGMTTKNRTPLYTLTFYKFDTDPALAESAYENFSLIIYKGSNVVKIVIPEKTAAIMGLPKSLSEYTFKVTNSKLHKVIELIEKQSE